MEFFHSLPIWWNFGILGLAGVFVWLGGVKIEGAVQTISKRTSLGTAFGGMLLLALSTSLPEIATTVTGGVLGDAELLTNNLLGGVTMQTAVLAVADMFLRRGALTHFAPSFVILLSGVLLVMLLGAAVTIMVMHETISIAQVGLGTTAIFITHILLSYGTYRSRDNPRWEAVIPEKTERAAEANPKEPKITDENMSLRKAWVVFAMGSLVILLGGSVVMMAAEALTTQTALGASFIGATFVAITTSLPELSTTTTAVRRGHHALAISNILGSNLWCVSLLFVGDLFFRSGPLLTAAPRQAIFNASLGIVMTCVYLWGLLERKDRTIWRFGVDSVVVLVLYVGGLVVLYTMR